MTLTELMEKVKEPNLTKTQLEEYRDELVNLVALMHLEAADIEKKEAIYMVDMKAESDIATKRLWMVTNEGQRLIVLKRYIQAVNKLTDNLRSRLYSTY